MYSPELTFFPKRYPYEFRKKEDAEKVVVELFRELISRKINLYPKVDPFRNPFSEGETYCIEVVCYQNGHYTYYEKDTFLQNVGTLIEIMKSYDCVPLQYVNKKNGIKECATGGCHIHMGISDLFPRSADFFANLEFFNENLLMFFINHPEIRWLFSQWFDNINSNVLYTDVTNVSCLAKSQHIDMILRSGSSIEPRFMETSWKASFSTYEFRFFNMVNSAEEGWLYIEFLEAYKKYVLKLMHSQIHIEFELTNEKLKSLWRIKDARRNLEKLFETLELDFSKYLVFFDRNYKNRIKFGKMA